MKRALSCAMVGVTLLCAAVAAAEPDSGDNGELKSGLYTTGAVILAAPYPLLVLTASIGVASDDDNLAWLYLPVAGPFIAARAESTSTGIDAALIATGIIQSMGLGMLIVAPFIPDDEEEPEAALTIAPMATPSGVTLTVGATF